MYYTNLQRFDVSGRFSVAQRRVAWLLKRHPKKYYRKRGAMWVFGLHRDISGASDAELDLLWEKALRQIWNVAQERRRRKDDKWFNDVLAAVNLASALEGFPSEWPLTK